MYNRRLCKVWHESGKKRSLIAPLRTGTLPVNIEIGHIEILIYLSVFVTYVQIM